MSFSADALRDIALKVAKRAALPLQRAQEDIGEIQTKSSKLDWVTKWDVETEELIKADLQKETPSISILGEEKGLLGDDGNSDCWLVDPIDGTVNFGHGLPHFAVSIAYQSSSELLCGVTIAPVLGWTFAAAKGHGATLNGAPLKVSKRSALDESMLASGFPYDRAITSHNFKAWNHMQRKACGCRRFGAATLDLAMVAAGWLDGYWESRLSPWDLAAGALLVREAGGVVTGLDGGVFDPHLGHAMASNGLIHDEMQKELKEVLS